MKPSTVIKLITIGSNPYDGEEGSHTWNAFVDCCCSVSGVDNETTIEKMMRQHSISLEYYETHLSAIEADGHIKIIDRGES